MLSRPTTQTSRPRLLLNPGRIGQPRLMELQCPRLFPHAKHEMEPVRRVAHSQETCACREQYSQC